MFIWTISDVIGIVVIAIFVMIILFTSIDK